MGAQANSVLAQRPIMSAFGIPITLEHVEEVALGRTIEARREL